MKNVIILNASPRKNFNTAQVLKAAQKGCESVGAKVEYVNLFDVEFKGCRSCYACKIKGSKTKGLCAVKDGLRPILEKIVNADTVIIGTPIYCGNQTGTFRNLYERMMFAAISFMVDENTGMPRKILEKKIAVGIVQTMGATEEQYKQSFTPALSGLNETMARIAFGYCETLNIFDTSHFDDYSKYDCNMVDGNHKKQIRENQFPKDLETAFDFGKRLTEIVV